jgi:glycosyltransferase involved in cell wall biosynthesis
MKLSVVIPTHNRASVLKTCLNRLREQKGADFEVIVVDDGSTDNTETTVREMIAAEGTKAMHTPGGALKLRYFKQPASQQGVARNRGVREAQGDIVLFIGDDIWAGPDFLARHMAAHAEHSEENTAVLGFSTWDSSLEINEYMKFLEASGWQFGYGFLKPGFVAREPYKFFYTSNLSMKKSFFEKEKFDESFRGYGWEDIELGYRLFKNHGLKLWYEPLASATHYHLIPETDLPKKMQAVGKSAVVFETLHPEVRVVPKGVKRLILRIVTQDWILALVQKISKPLYFKLASWKYFFSFS